MVATPDPNAEFHIEYALRVADGEASLRFYRDLVGCELWDRTGTVPGGTRAWALRYGDMLLRLFDTGDDTRIDPRSHYMTFHVVNVDEISAEGVAAGYPVRRFRWSPTVDCGFTADPDGRSIEWSEGSPWYPAGHGIPDETAPTPDGLE